MDCCREDTKTGLFGEFSQRKAFSLHTSLRINQGQNEKKNPTKLNPIKEKEICRGQPDNLTNG